MSIGELLFQSAMLSVSEASRTLHQLQSRSFAFGSGCHSIFRLVA